MPDPRDNHEIRGCGSFRRRETRETKGHGALRHIKVRGGRPPSISGAPVQSVEDTKASTTAAFLGADFPGLRPSFHVSEGERVQSGADVFHDRKHPQIVFVAPFTGVVSGIEYGPRRTLSACILKRDADAPSVERAGPIEKGDAASVRTTLQVRGLWPAFRTRPFGHIPTPDAQPSAIFITATQNSTLAPDPQVVLENQLEEFMHGVSIIKGLTAGDVHICQSRSDALCPEDDRIKTTIFAGSTTAALASTHIDYLHPVGASRHVWTIGYQDVAAIGHLFLTGRYLADRVISIAGPRAIRPRLVRACLGAGTHELGAQDVAEDHTRFLSGDPTTGREAAFLGRFHQQLTLTHKKPTQGRLSRLLRAVSAQGALIPTSALEHATGPRILPVPLMRALSVGDSEAAELLGCLSLIEEDVTTLSRLCTSGADYGALLRQTLDDLAENMA